MSEPIKVGDLVVITRQHCNDENVGVITTVIAISLNPEIRCRRCAAIYSVGTVALLEETNGRAGYQPLCWLKRIPPLSELEGEKREEKVKA